MGEHNQVPVYAVSTALHASYYQCLRTFNFLGGAVVEEPKSKDLGSYAK